MPRHISGNSIKVGSAKRQGRGQVWGGGAEGVKQGCGQGQGK